MIGLGSGCGFEQRDRVLGELLAKEKNSQVQFSFVERRLEGEDLAVVDGGFSVFVLNRLGEGQIEEGRVIRWICEGGLNEEGLGLCGLTRIKSLDAVLNGGTDSAAREGARALSRLQDSGKLVKRCLPPDSFTSMRRAGAISFSMRSTAGCSMVR